MDAWLTASLPFWNAAAAQLLTGGIRLLTSGASQSYFAVQEGRHDYVPPKEREHPDYPAEALRPYLPAEYRQQNVGRTFSKNGDAATVLTGTVTLLAALLVAQSSVSPLTALLGSVILAVGVWRAAILLRMDVEDYKPKLFHRIELSPSVVLLVGALLLAGILVSVAAGLTDASPGPRVSHTP